MACFSTMHASHTNNKSLSSPQTEKTTHVMWQLDSMQILLSLSNKPVWLDQKGFFLVSYRWYYASASGFLFFLSDLITAPFILSSANFINAFTGTKKEIEEDFFFLIDSLKKSIKPHSSKLLHCLKRLQYSIPAAIIHICTQILKKESVTWFNMLIWQIYVL